MAGDPETWTTQRILQWTAEFFTGKGIDSPRLDAEILLADTLACDRVKLYTHFDQPLSVDERSRYRERVKRRAAREPVAYILGNKEFYSRDFIVNRHVLVPRPETEHIVEQVLKWVEKQGYGEGSTDTGPLRIADIATGSGNIAITLACELPEAVVTATDLSGAALGVAEQNVKAHEVSDRLRLFEGDLLAALPAGETFDVIVSNPPYVETGAKPELAPEITQHEPAMALYSGADGLDALRTLAAGVPERLGAPALFVCEFDPAQAEGFQALLQQGGAFAEVALFDDLARLHRGVRAER